MKCPCCNSEMSAGVVQSAREIFFTTEANQNWLNPFLANKNKIMLSTNNFSRPTCTCLLYTSPSPRDQRASRMPSSA